MVRPKDNVVLSDGPLPQERIRDGIVLGARSGVWGRVARQAPAISDKAKVSQQPFLHRQGGTDG